MKKAVLVALAVIAVVIASPFVVFAGVNVKALSMATKPDLCVGAVRHAYNIGLLRAVWEIDAGSTRAEVDDRRWAHAPIAMKQVTTAAVYCSRTGWSGRHTVSVFGQADGLLKGTVRNGYWQG